MVHIEVYDGNLLDLLAVSAHCVTCCHCNVVDEAEAIRASFLLVVRMISFSKDASMMARRSCGAECISEVATHDFVNGLNRSPSGNKSSIPRLFRDWCVHVVKDADDFVVGASELVNVFHDFLDVIEIVDFQNIRDFCSVLNLFLQDKGRS